MNEIETVSGLTNAEEIFVHSDSTGMLTKELDNINKLPLTDPANKATVERVLERHYRIERNQAKRAARQARYEAAIARRKETGQ